MPEAARKKVAIACQGGGSHAAFAAGVLQRVLAADLRERYQLVALSGTSGGAMCAALAWAGLLLDGPDDAIARLGAFWNDLKAQDAIDSAVNQWGLWTARSPVTVDLSPYAYPPLAEQRLMQLVQDHIPLSRISQRLRSSAGIRLLVGATDVLKGDRVVFDGSILTHRHLIASAAVPPLYRAIRIDGGLYWDGLFTSNPPVREFTEAPGAAGKPDEIWVIQINPQRQGQEPVQIGDIVDRRNELSGNLALAQELYFIDKINDLVRQHGKLLPGYKHIELKYVELPSSRDLDYASKLDRRPSFIESLMDMGREMGAQLHAPAGAACASSLPVRNVYLS
ncbi:MAG TPA: patatin-like phospholipase family protein [Ideonella sp.]|nr:patatin-like phospholipase family protein [Ideonella sp.]